MLQFSPSQETQEFEVCRGEDAKILGALAEVVVPTALEHKEISQGFYQLHILENYMTT